MTRLPDGAARENARAGVAGLVLGGFTLLEPLGAGAMGQVWSARHRASGALAAVKLLGGELARQPRYRAAFRAEVRAIAALDHPGVVRVFDHGELPGAVPEADIVAGTPWLAMEQLDGPLERPRRAGWPWLYRVLMETLDALAHAHARGTLHRDLKPGNLMRRGRRVCLVDFGLAHAWGAERSGDTFAEAIVGTPSYMAPEQVAGSARELGPWTDLYAVGCLAYRFAAGRAPFSRSGRSSDEVMAAHVHEDVPELESRFAVPRGFADWVARLLDKAPSARFRHAADAAWALFELGRADAEAAEGAGEAIDEGLTTGDIELSMSFWDEVGASISRVGSRVREPSDSPADLEPAVADLDDLGDDALTRVAPRRRPTSDDATFLGREATVVTQTRARTRAASSTSGAFEAIADHELPPMPRRWQRPARRPVGPVARDASLGLFGLREPPLFGRDEARDVLWSLLGDVYAHGTVRVAVVRGPSGFGRTRLVRWLTCRAAEVGAARSLAVSHSVHGTTRHGLRGALARHLDVDLDDAREVHHRVVELLSALGIHDADEAATLSGWLHGGDDAVSFSSPAERNRLVRRVLGCLARRRRPRLVWLDDVHHDPAALELVDDALANTDTDDAPLLFVVTACEEALCEQAALAARLDTLQRDPRVARVEVGALEPLHARQLAEHLLGRASTLTATLTTRSAGNPSFIVQLVTDWVERGVLVAGARGLKLVPGTDAEPPPTMLDVWQRRLDALEASEGEVAALELAAALGTTVDLPEWLAVCAREPLSPTVAVALLERLLGRGLARTLEASGAKRRLAAWSFGNVLLREAIVQRARAAGRWRARHLACARALGAREAVAPERRGIHLAEAGALDAALRPLLDGVERQVALADHDRAEVLLQRCEVIAETLSLTHHDPRLVDIWSARAALARVRGEARAREWSRRAVDAARRGGWPETSCRALLAHVAILRNAGENDAAVSHALEAAERAAELRDPLWAGRAHRALGVCTMVKCLFDEATLWFERARRAFDAARESDPVEAGICVQCLGVIAMRQGNDEAALRHYADAMARFEAARCRYWKANCHNDRAECLRHMGRLDEAELDYRRTIELYDALGATAVVPRANLGLVHVARGELDEAIALLEPAVAEVRAATRYGLLAQLIVYQLPCYAAHGNDDEFDAALEEASRLLAGSGVATVDCAHLAGVAAESLVARRELERARAAWTLSLAQWSRLGRLPERDRVAQRLASLSGALSPALALDEES